MLAVPDSGHKQHDLRVEPDRALGTRGSAVRRGTTDCMEINGVGEATRTASGSVWNRNRSDDEAVVNPDLGQGYASRSKLKSVPLTVPRGHPSRAYSSLSFCSAWWLEPRLSA